MEYITTEEYDHKLIFTITALQNSIDSEKVSTNNARTVPATTKLKLPRIPLPEYAHEGEDLFKFFTNFEQILQKYELTEYEKFVYLQNQLSNEPLTLIKSLKLADQNYATAKALLEQAFGSPLTQQFRVLHNLENLKLAATDDPYQFISDMRLIIDSFERLKIDTKVILQYFIWNGLNNEMKTQLVHITNTNKPSLDEIQKHIFDATERYTSLRKFNSQKSSHFKKDSCKQSGKTDQAVNAAAVNYQDRSSDGKKPKFCTLCSTKDKRETSHSTFECKSYPTPEAKIKKINEIGGCIRCANTNHNTKECRYRFNKRCFKCSKYHFSFLCSANSKSAADSTKANAKSEPKSSKENKQVQSSSVNVYNTTVEQYGEDAIIPTFSIRLPDNSVIRCMRDSGCQPNFISQKAARRQKLRIVCDNFSLGVKGFNSKKNYNCKIVELRLIEDELPILAICVPEIKTNIKLPGLTKIVKTFISNGYDFADEFLEDAGDEISGLDFVLGNNDANVLPQEDVKFGTNPSSVYSKTKLGIMLLGGTKRMLKNLKSLSNCNENFKVESACLDHTNNSHDAIVSENEVSLLSMKIAIDKAGFIENSVLDNAVDEMINMHRARNMEYDNETYIDDRKECNDLAIKFVLDNTRQLQDGRLEMPLIWDDKVAHLLGRNYKLSRSVLRTNLRRLQQNEEHLYMYDDVIKEQESSGVIERIDDIKQYLVEHPNISYLSHMGVFRPERESTKCRVVLLSNLVEKRESDVQSVSHNQAISCGPNLNRKITTAVTKLRFDKFLLCFDISKAFLNIALRSIDQDALLFHWLQNVRKNDFSVVTYKFTRLPFGLRCSLALLLLAMYKILILNAKNDDPDLKELKALIYDRLYMDNGAYSTNSAGEMANTAEMLNGIFNPFKFELQQFVTNLESLQISLDSRSCTSTDQETKLLGMVFNRITDTLSTPPLRLDTSANTKRKILSSIAGNYDALQINGPLINRARLYMHSLQCNTELQWDTVISNHELKEWKNLCKQLNAAPSLVMPRYIGQRDSDFRLVAFTDASKQMFGTVVYIQEL